MSAAISDPYLTVPQLARAVGRPERTIRAWCKLGMRHSRPNRQMFSKVSWFNEWLEKHLVESDVAASD